MYTYLFSPQRTILKPPSTELSSGALSLLALSRLGSECNPAKAFGPTAVPGPSPFGAPSSLERGLPWLYGKFGRNCQAAESGETRAEPLAVQRLQKVLLQSVDAQGPYAYSPRRKAIRVLILPQVFYSVRQLGRAPASAHRRKALWVSHLPQTLFTVVLRQDAHSHSHGRTAVCLRTVRESILRQVRAQLRRWTFEIILNLPSPHLPLKLSLFWEGDSIAHDRHGLRSFIVRHC